LFGKCSAKHRKNTRKPLADLARALRKPLALGLLFGHIREQGNPQRREVDQMRSKIRNGKAAFTLVEIMIVVAIIGLLAALAIPGFVKARKQSQGRRILNDARQMDAAIDQWALENGKKDDDAVITTSAATYLKTAWPTNDLLGNAYSVGNVGPTQVQISSTTKDALSGVGIDWGAY
jgi:type IV pilus assembly protein PilA